MTKVLGVDYGQSKMGLAIGDTKVRLAEPLRILRYQDTKILVEKIKRIVQAEKIEKVVVGISEGKMGEESKNFGKKLEKVLGIPVVFQDETLTSMDAQSYSIEAGIGRKKRKALEDAYAACLILQSWFDKKPLSKGVFTLQDV